MEGHSLLPYTNRRFTWTNQEENREQWEEITNKQGTIIKIPPRRYAIQLQLKPGKTELNQTQINQMKKILTQIHTYSYAPEPLKNITSTFQMINKNANMKTIILYLTNISSQAVRRDLMTEIMIIMKDYKPEITWIQMNTENERVRTYSTTTREDVIEVLLQRADTTQQMLWTNPPQPPWKTQARNIILIQHTATNQAQEAVPERMKTKIQEDDMDQNLAQVAEKVEQQLKKKMKTTQEKHTSPSSSTKQINHQTGNKQKDTNHHQHLSPSTTEHITTSSTPATIEEEMEQDSEDELLDTWVQQLQEIQKSMQRTIKFVFSGESFYIASGTVSKQQISMVLESTKK